MTKKRRKSYSRQPVLRRRKNGVFYIHHQYQGRQVRQSTRTRLRAEAEEQLAQYRKSLTGNQNARSINLTVWKGIEGWLADRMAPRLGLQPSTLAGYKTFAKKLKSVVPPGLLVRDLVRSDIRSALDRLFDKGNSQIQIAKCGTTFSQACNYLVIEGHLTHNPCVKVCPPAKYAKRSAMPQEAYEALLVALRRECSCPGLSSASRNSRQDLLDLVELCWGSGLRFIEMTRMTWKDIDLDELTFQTHSPPNKGGELTRPGLTPIFRTVNNVKADWGLSTCKVDGGNLHSPHEYSHEDFITPYAHSGSTVEEDSCEPLMNRVLYKGNDERYRNTRPGVFRKLKFIATLPQKVKSLDLA